MNSMAMNLLEASVIFAYLGVEIAHNDVNVPISKLIQNATELAVKTVFIVFVTLTKKKYMGINCNT